MLIDFGINGSSDRNISSKTKNWSYGNVASESAGQEWIEWTSTDVSDVSTSNFDWGITIGGETSYENTNEGEFDTAVTIVEENQSLTDGELWGYTTTETYINFSENEEGSDDADAETHGDEDEEPRERTHTVIEVYVSPGQDDVVTVHKDKAPSATGGLRHTG